jgi:poly(3-hydroxybutyrate) depolymerase
LVAISALLAACAAREQPALQPASSGASLDAIRAGALTALAAARASSALSDVARTVSLPSVERMIEDADDRRAHVTSPDRDAAFARTTMERARVFAERLVAGDDPYRGLTGELVKAYRSEWDGTLQPYALYVPPGYDAGRDHPWPLVMALHGAYSDHKHNLRRVFGLENRPGETDAEASRNELPLPDVPALVVSPYGRGEFMGYDGLGEDDVLRVLADVRRAYDVDPDRITLTGLSMGGGGTWNIGLRHPDLFAALAPVCGVTDSRGRAKVAGAELYDEALLDVMSPLAVAENAGNLQVLVFHGAADPTVSVEDSRRMVERYRALGWLGKNVEYTEYPGVGHFAWIPAYKDAALLRRLAAMRRDPVPRHVVVATPTLRYDRAYWLRVDALAPAAAPRAGRLEGDLGDGKIAVRADGVDGFSLLLESTTLVGQRIHVTIDGAPSFDGAAEPVLSFARAGARAGGRWARVPAPLRAPVPDHAVSGLFGKSVPRERPHLYVYGTGGDPAVVAAARALAEAMADWGPGTSLRPRVKADTEVTDDEIARLDLVLVGAGSVNSLVRRLAPADPGDAAAAGDRAYRQLAASRANPDRQLLVLAASSARGVGHLRRFAVRTRDAWAPESNLDLVTFDEQGKVETGAVYGGGGAAPPSAAGAAHRQGE